MFKKKADSNVDWAISLGIFVLYLAWFFIFVRPQLVQEQRPDHLASINDNFIEATQWTVFKHPIFLKSNFSLQNEPIVVPYRLKYGKSNVFIANKTFMLDNRLLFVADISNQSSYYLINSAENYTPYHEVTDLSASSNSATTANFSASFSNGLLQSASFFWQSINGFSLSVDGSPINTNNNVFSSNEAAAKYEVVTLNLNNSLYVFEKNPRIYGYIDPADNFSIEVGVKVNSYQNYFIDASNFGLVAGGCISGYGNLLNLYTNSSNLLVAFNNPVSIFFCSENTTMNLQFNFTTENVSSYKIIFFNGDHAEYEKYASPYSARVGIPETVTGISYMNLINLSSVNYAQRRSEWGGSNFRANVGNFSYGGVPYENANVYSLSYNAFIVDKFANLDNATVNLRSWT